jgi:hypothetical protein
LTSLLQAAVRPAPREIATYKERSKLRCVKSNQSSYPLGSGPSKKNGAKWANCSGRFDVSKKVSNDSHRAIRSLTDPFSSE